MRFTHQDLLTFWESDDEFINVEVRRVSDRFLVKVTRAGQITGWRTYETEIQARQDFEKTVSVFVEGPYPQDTLPSAPQAAQSSLWSRVKAKLKGLI
jgi:hypothetical protein